MVAEAVIPQIQAPNVVGVIRQASRATGVSFEYMLATAQVESRLNPNARAQTSSARGLYQFIEQTWLETMKRAGATHGYAQYANAIARTDSGRYVVADPAMRGEILKLRADPAANALMAGEFTNRNTQILASRLGRAPTDGELYMAHFLGPSGAARLIALANRSPDANAATIYPNAARANRSIFFDRQGHARSAAEVTDVLAGRYNVARNIHKVPATVAVVPADAVAPVQPPAPPLPPSIEVFAPRAALAAISPGAGSASALAPAAPARVAATRPVFPNLFRDDGERRDPVSPVVRELWSPQPAAEPNAVAPATPAEPQALPAAPGAPLDLFREMKPDIRAMFRRSA